MSNASTPSDLKFEFSNLKSSLVAALLLFAMALPACQRRADERPLDEAGFGFSAIRELHELQVIDPEVAELVKAKQAGTSDAACVELIRIARSRNRPFASGDAIASLRRAGMGEQSALELARLDQLGLWVGEVQAMRLAGASDAVILALARRHAAGQPTLSGPSIARLRNAGVTEVTLLDLINRGATDAEAEKYLQSRRPAGSRFHSARRPR